MKKIIFALIITFFSQQLTFAQQAWTSPKGKFYSQLGYTSLVYDGSNKAYDEIIPLNRKITHNALQGYIQYGITDKLMVTGIVPLTFTSSKLTSGTQPTGLSDGSLNGLGNIQTALTYRFYEKNGIVFSGKLNAILPTAQKDVATGLRTGDDTFGISPSLLAGYGHSKFFASAEIGYGYRTNKYSSQSLINAQIGKLFGKKQKFIAIFNTVNRVSSKNGSYQDTNNKYTGFFLNNLSYNVIGLKFGYKITPKLMIWTNIRSTSPGGVPQNIGEPSEPLPAYSISISYNR